MYGHLMFDLIRSSVSRGTASGPASYYAAVLKAEKGDLNDTEISGSYCWEWCLPLAANGRRSQVSFPVLVGGDGIVRKHKSRSILNGNIMRLISGGSMCVPAYVPRKVLKRICPQTPELWMQLALPKPCAECVARRCKDLRVFFFFCGARFLLIDDPSGVRLIFRDGMSLIMQGI